MVAVTIYTKPRTQGVSARMTARKCDRIPLSHWFQTRHLHRCASSPSLQCDTPTTLRIYAWIWRFGLAHPDIWSSFAGGGASVASILGFKHDLGSLGRRYDMNDSIEEILLEDDAACGAEKI